MKGKPRTQQKQHRSRRAFLAFLLPSFLGVAVFVLVPFIDVFRRSFTTAVTGEFTGLEIQSMISWLRKMNRLQ